MARNRKKSRGALSLFFLAIPVLLFGLVFAGIGLAIWSGAQAYDDGVLTTGTVVGHDRSNDGDTWASVVEFETESGETVTFVGSAYSSGRDPVGSDVRVSYRAADPEGARNLDDAGSTIGLIFAGVGSVAVLGAVIGLVLGGFRRLRRQVSGGEGLQSYENLTSGSSSPVSSFDASGTDFISGEDRGF